jgi:hypothetical protein
MPSAAKIRLEALLECDFSLVIIADIASTGMIPMVHDRWLGPSFLGTNL